MRHVVPVRPGSRLIRSAPRAACRAGLPAAEDWWVPTGTGRASGRGGRRPPHRPPPGLELRHGTGHWSQVQPLARMHSIHLTASHAPGLELRHGTGHWSVVTGTGLRQEYTVFTLPLATRWRSIVFSFFVYSLQLFVFFRFGFPFYRSGFSFYRVFFFVDISFYRVDISFFFGVMFVVFSSYLFLFTSLLV